MLHEIPWSGVSVGGMGRACGVRQNEQLECWGGANAQAGTWLDGGDWATAWGQPPTGKYKSTSLSYHLCALRKDNTISCWGDEQSFKETPEGVFGSFESGYN